MTCQEAQEHMMGALDGHMPDTERLRFQDHLQLCRECAQTWLALQQVDAVLRAAPMATPPANFARRASRAALETGQRQHRIVGPLLLGVGGLLVSLLFVFSALLSGGSMVAVLTLLLFGQLPGMTEALIEGMWLLLRMVWVAVDVWRTAFWGPLFWPVVALVAFSAAIWLAMTYITLRRSWAAATVR